MSNEFNEQWLDKMFPTMKRDDPLRPKFPSHASFPNEVYILCHFSTNITSNMSPHDIQGVYMSKEILELNFPDLVFNWDVKKTSEYVVGVAGKPDAETSDYFILARSLINEVWRNDQT